MRDAPLSEAEARALRDELEALQQALADGTAGVAQVERELAELAKAVAEVEDELELVRRHLFTRKPAVERVRREERARSLPGLSLLLIFAGAVLLAGSASTWSVELVLGVGASGAAGLGALAGWRR